MMGETMSESLSKAMLDELLNNALDNRTVQHLLREAMRVTDENDREYGGFIFKSGDGNMSVKRFGGDRGAIVLDGSPGGIKARREIEKVNGIIIADYHCHPGKNPNSCKPSQEDVDNARELTWRRLVITNVPKKVFQNPVGSRRHAKQTLDNLLIWDVNTAVS
jgi:proteasome lid subunit RPN8/RPN11